VSGSCCVGNELLVGIQSWQHMPWREIGLVRSSFMEDGSLGLEVSIANSGF
jgi:hypothetical protein